MTASAGRTKELIARHSSLTSANLPPLPLEQWRPRKETLHRYLQITGKVRLEHTIGPTRLR